uniref:Uncharacterized protein n=1 Tax=Oryza barthii TaxID=65489 RepID=A0A0D3HMN2_9ORYZ
MSAREADGWRASTAAGLRSSGAAAGGGRTTADEFAVMPPAGSCVAATHTVCHYEAAVRANPVLVVLVPFVGSERKAKQGTGQR